MILDYVNSVLTDLGYMSFLVTFLYSQHVEVMSPNKYVKIFVIEGHIYFSPEPDYFVKIEIEDPTFRTKIDNIMKEIKLLPVLRPGGS